MRRSVVSAGLGTAAMLAAAGGAFAHNIAGKDAAFVSRTAHADPLPFAYLGAKHMVTGYDHLLFLAGVIFFLFRFRQIAVHVTLFSLGHSITLLLGVLAGIRVNSHWVDAVIGLSVVYKAFDNIGGFRTFLGVQPDARIVVFLFGLVHGFGLATKLQTLRLNPNGLLTNLVSFNIGVELGQLIALAVILAAMTLWRRTGSFGRMAVAANVLLMTAGFVLAGAQIAEELVGAAA